MSPKMAFSILLVSLCSIYTVSITKATVDNYEGTSSLRFACSQHCQKKVLFDVNCNNGEATITKFDHSIGDWINKLQDKITKLSGFFDNSSDGSGNAMDIISSIEDQVTSLEEKVDHLIENLGVQMHS